MQSSSQGYRGYQGYPYVNPMVNDVPSIDPETASRWANMPRRQVQVPGPSRVYPGTSGAGSSSQDSQQPQTSRDPVPPKKDIDANPVVYIDLPEVGSEVSQSIDSPDSQEPNFVQETIMYDPFDNRRIDIPKDDANSVASSVASSSYSDQNVQYSHQNPRPIYMRPNTLDIATPGSGSQSSSTRPTPGTPGFMTKETLVYGSDGADGFPISPIPISEFPQPPPAYTEVAATPLSPIQNLPVQEQPPRTQVITPDPISPITPGTMNLDRKNLICHHCGIRVHTLVVREVGLGTHIIACIVFIMCMPLVILIYLTDVFKYKNHYCPNCNRLIGYVLPIVGRNVNYVT